MSPLRALQYSSALDTYSVPKDFDHQSELLTLHKQIKQTDAEIFKLKQSLTGSPIKVQPLRDVGKNISYNLRNPISNSRNEYFLGRASISRNIYQYPDPRFSGINPITGESRNVGRTPSPYSDKSSFFKSEKTPSLYREIPKRYNDYASISRPFFS